MNLRIFIIPLLTSVVATSCDGFRILAIFPFSAKSHFAMFEELLKSLARAGHRVDVVSLFPLKESFPNYTDIVKLKWDFPTLVNNLSMDFIENEFRENIISFIATVAGNEICKNLDHPDILKIVKNPPNDPPYDAFITEIFGAHCYMIIGHQLKIPIIGASSSELYPWGHEMIANPRNLAFVPFELLPMTPPFSYWERMKNCLLYWWSYHEFNYYTRPQDDMIRKNFGEDAPGVRELERSVSMILVNSHISVNGAKSVTAGVIEVGGLHIRDDGPELPENLQKWLDESAHGFIYFTFGSMARIETLPKETLAVLYKSFGKIAPVRVLVKIARPQELPDGLPGNVITQTWIQQLKVLKHKNVRAFITHGGLMGTQEAIHCGVPMIGVPLFADQFVNINNYVEKKIALYLDYKTITEEKLDAAIDAILNDPVYAKSARAISEKFRDRPLTPAETAVYWVEYVIKHGSQALRSPASDLTWWQEALLDVYVALVLALLIIIYAIVRIVGALVRLIFGKKSDGKRASLSKKNN